MLYDLDLPPHLEERCILQPGPEVTNPLFVLHWMRNAIRLDESPTFDTARHIANSLEIPLLVYHGIDERYPHASYRHHRFLLEGAADVAHRAEKIGVDHLIHVSRSGHRIPSLLHLAGQAAIVVTDLVDLQPWKGWTDKVAEKCNVIQVDSHCVLPRPVFGKSKDRPFRFRKATKKEVSRRVTMRWPNVQSEIIRLPRDWEPPFEPVDVRRELMKDGAQKLLSDCDIDPTVVGVSDIRGGYNAAIKRWMKWCESGLKKYHQTRNNAADRDGVSGMSPYIHYGMISPTRMVRDAADIGGKGSEKFLDEMLVFREHAYHHAHEISRPDHWRNLPEWAKESWNNRPLGIQDSSSIDLERGKSRDPLWDSSQIGLIRHGVMHNNVRMTWGKSFASWKQDPSVAMSLALSLNDRYALDGRDPNSIAGVQWCFGLFDRPFDPSKPTMGRVRARPTSSHMTRLDMDRFRDWTEAATLGGKISFGIVGGGLSGCFAARLLTDLGHEVTIFDKGRRPSGRLASRILAAEQSFQLGARSLDSMPIWAKRHVKDWEFRGLVELREGKVMPKRPFPELLEHLGEETTIRHSCRVTEIEDTENQVSLSGIRPEGKFKLQFDYVLVALPIEQARDLCNPIGFEIEGRSEASWVAWGPFTQDYGKIPENWNFTIHDGLDMLEVRLDGSISQENIDLEPVEIVRMVTDKLGIPPEQWEAHRWRFGQAVEGPKKVIHKSLVSVIGDGFGQPIGTAGAAIDSAARAVSDLHLTRLTTPEITREVFQSSLSDW